jgi:hypothetical protein
MTRDSSRITVTRTLMTLTPALLVGAVAVGLVGGGGTGAASAGENTAAPAAPATPVTACLTDDLTGTVTGLPGEAGAKVRGAVLQLTNTSGRACRTPEWADLALVTPPGELVRVPTRKVGQAGATAIVLQPEASAWSAIEWDACAPGRTGCGVGVAWQYILDRESTGSVADTVAVPEADQDGVAMKAMRVGPLRPAHVTTPE